MQRSNTLETASIHREIVTPDHCHQSMTSTRSGRSCTWSVTAGLSLLAWHLQIPLAKCHYRGRSTPCLINAAIIIRPRCSRRSNPLRGDLTQWLQGVMKLVRHMPLRSRQWDFSSDPAEAALATLWQWQCKAVALVDIAVYSHLSLKLSTTQKAARPKGWIQDIPPQKC